MSHVHVLYRDFCTWLHVKFSNSRAVNEQESHGQGLVEYALILVLVAVVVVGALAIFGGTLAGVYESIQCDVVGAGTTAGLGGLNCAT